MTNIKVNPEQRLYVIPCGKGYTCLGFDVCAEWTDAYLTWIGQPLANPVQRGTIAAYEIYERACELASARAKSTGRKCPAHLTPELIGLEGKRVEVTLPGGEKSRFTVGKSSGWAPIHLEIKRRDSTGGGAVYFPKGATVRVVG